MGCQFFSHSRGKQVMENVSFFISLNLWPYICKHRYYSHAILTLPTSEVINIMVLTFTFPQISHIACSKPGVFSTSVCNFGNTFHLFLEQRGTTYVKVANYSLPLCHFLPKELQLIYLLFKYLSGDDGCRVGCKQETPVCCQVLTPGT